ncbi:glycoside hydrolase family 28 protein [Novosphingobium sp. 9]|uniref:rhamnogalacturonidase n=1 Tax=Novosphingobium sp. 9 TaxID=2025349 RepID=UPI0021B54324|nr:glycosyl hydrolase family 28-related protein [Novosphingobium sp. 9]
MALMPRPAFAAQTFDIRHFGARGDGETLDTDAINAAIHAAARAGGGVVTIPAGRYLCFSIRLASRVSLRFEAGAVIIAADPARHAGRYDLPEDRGAQLYQDFGHSHWHNSLIWGDGVEDVALEGPGRIEGGALTRNGPGARWQAQTGERPLSMQHMTKAEITALESDHAAMERLGNKAIALRMGRRIRLSGLTIAGGGHIAVLATGTQGLTIENLTIDTARDGIDLDCVRDVTVSGCRINTPNDDAIVVKSSLALGEKIASENVTIRDCQVSGYDLGTMLSGTNGTTQALAPDRDRPTGRIKLGTESNGGYHHILIERCRFAHCRGLALETVDGGAMEDVIARELFMEDVTTAPIFVRVGNRGRGPHGTAIGSTRGIRIERVFAQAIDPRYPAILAGIPGHPVRDVTLSQINLTYAGGGTASDAARQVPEVPNAYPEPSMFGVLPAWGLWMRDVERISLDRIALATAAPDARPPIMLDRATG